MKGEKKEKSAARLFVKVFVIVVIIGLVLCGIVFSMIKEPVPEETQGGEAPAKNPITFMADLISREKDFNMAFFGVDGDETRTDVIFIMHYNARDNKASILSVPRDTRVQVCSEAKALIESTGHYAPYECKINEVHSYGREKGVEAVLAQLKDLLGINIDYYGKINLKGFVELVDEIGGVDIDVPQDMYYDDPYQDLHINLKKGIQHLDGEHAEMLVRFRSYPQGDVERVLVQQMFLKEVASKLLDPATVKANIGGYIRIFVKYADTDFSLSSLLKYGDNFAKIHADEIVMETLPGAGGYVGDTSYYLVDEDEAPEAINRIFGSKSENKADSKNFRIEVSNGGEIDGYAAEWRQKLKADGYNVVNITTFQGTKTPETRIIVSESGMGVDLIPYFKSAEVIEDVSLLNSGTDIRIILGMNE